MILYRDLEKVRQIIDEATGLEVSYAYENLVFPDHTAFIIQYDDENKNNFFCFFHEDCPDEDRSQLLKNLSHVCQTKKCTISDCGSYTLEQQGEEVKIKFS